MEQILKAHEKLEKKANLGKAIDDVQSIIDKLKTTRNAVTTGMCSEQDDGALRHYIRRPSFKQLDCSLCTSKS